MHLPRAETRQCEAPPPRNLLPGFRRPIFPLNIGWKPKKRSSRLPTSNFSPNIRWRPKKDLHASNVPPKICFATWYGGLTSRDGALFHVRPPPGWGVLVSALHPPSPAIFKHVFDEYNFFIISNLFDDNKLYALSMHCITENLRTKCIIFGEALRFRGKIFKQNLPKNCSKSTKMATTVRKFSKTFRESMPLDPPTAFFILIMLQKISAGKKYA